MVKNLKFRANFDEKLENMKFTSNLSTFYHFLLIGYQKSYFGNIKSKSQTSYLVLHIPQLLMLSNSDSFSALKLSFNKK